MGLYLSFQRRSPSTKFWCWAEVHGAKNFAPTSVYLQTQRCVTPDTFIIPNSSSVLICVNPRNPRTFFSSSFELIRVIR